MADQFGDKKHDATQHRRDQARQKGQVPKSQDLSSAVLLIAALASMLWLGKGMVQTLGEIASTQLSREAWITADAPFASMIGREMLVYFARILLPIFGTLLVVAIGANVSQIGILILPEKLKPDISHISLLKGVKRLFSLQSVMRLVLGIFKMGVVASVAVASLWNEIDQIMILADLEIPQIATYLAHVTIWTAMKIAFALLILALVDFAFQRWKFSQDLKMTDQEMREEMKSLQGDPQIAARRRVVQRQLALNRLSSAVPDADFVVTNPTELAVAVQYDPETMIAPLVVAKGAGVIAKRIRKLALEHDVPIIERKPLARVLYNEIDVGQPIPNEQFAAVAEVLRYVYELKGKTLPGMPKAA